FLVFARLAIAGGVLLPVAAARGVLRAAGARWPILLTIAAGGIVVPFLLIAYGEQHIPSSLAALLIAADPLFIVLLALWVDPAERASGWRLLGLLIGFLGVAAVLGVHLEGDPLAVLLGGGMVLGAALCYAVSALLVKRASGVSPLGATSLALAMACALLAPVAIWSVPARPPGWPVLGSLIALGLICTALGYVIYFSLIAAAGATRASLITYVNPAVAVVLGMLILGESITLGTLLGFLLIIVGCALSTDLPRTLARHVSRPTESVEAVNYAAAAPDATSGTDSAWDQLAPR
ncbi:MAG: DMT family transporter, partial [Chloroflexota bacterium]|nr:DMT family transporter [Chloroflexota bacterium]